jgi:mRNA-degrading endonuclease RelE of RelBE toxin-antitoxin system
MNHLKRVHIDKQFILVFSIDEKSKTVILEDYNHHDNIY